MASTRWSSLRVRLPSPRPVLPSSPVRVSICVSRLPTRAPVRVVVPRPTRPGAESVGVGAIPGVDAPHGHRLPLHALQGEHRGSTRPELPRPCANFHSNMRLAARSHLLAVAPRSTALAVKDALGLQLFPLDWSGGDEAISLAWRESSVSKPELVAFLECF